jgi:arylformamidase
VTYSSLEAEYNIRARHPEHQSVRDGWAASSAQAKAKFAWREDVRYGPAARQVLDLFPARAASAPLLVFVHGGYWRANDKANYGFIAEPVLEAGGALANINYGLAPDTPLGEIIEQTRAAILWLSNNAALGKFDNRRIHIAGHSAGGHLAAELLATDWPAYGAPADIVHGITAISGVFDLTPLIGTSINVELGLDQTSAQKFSPLFHPPPAGAPMIVAVGDGETEEFLHQSRSFADMCQTAGCASELNIVPGANHYTILNQLDDANTPLTRAVLRQMGLL